MNVIDPIRAEFTKEAGLTRQVLERVPADKFEWQPHAKSMTLGRLASHVAEIPGWAKMIIADDELRFSPESFKPRIAASAKELLEIHDQAVAESTSVLDGVTDEVLGKTWTMYVMDNPVVQGPKLEVLREWTMNHLVHHRGQLTVYLRLLDVPLPGIYGPTADSQSPMQQPS